MFCTQCGTKNEETSSYCYKCGSRLGLLTIESTGEELTRNPVDSTSSDPTGSGESPDLKRDMHSSSRETPGLIKALWRGELPLWKAYWLFAVLGGMAFALAFAYIEANSVRFLSIPGGEVVVWLLLGVATAYMVLVWVGVWRSADNYKGPATYRILARLAVIVGALGTIGNLVETLNPTITEYSLREEAASLNSQLPMMLDDETRLDSVTSDGMSFRYDYTLVNYHASAVDPNIFRRNMEPMLRETSCRDMKDYVDAGVVITYQYLDLDGNVVGAFDFDLAGCSASRTPQPDPFAK